jgi:hypothetical protein
MAADAPVLIHRERLLAEFQERTLADEALPAVSID